MMWSLISSIRKAILTSWSTMLGLPSWVCLAVNSGAVGVVIDKVGGVSVELECCGYMNQDSTHCRSN